MIGIDWVAVVVLGAAWAFSNVRTVPLHVRYWVMALAFFAVAGHRLYLGAAGLNLVFVGLAALFGAQYVARALKVPKDR